MIKKNNEAKQNLTIQGGGREFISSSLGSNLVSRVALLPTVVGRTETMETSPSIVPGILQARY